MRIITRIKLNGLEKYVYEWLKPAMKNEDDIEAAIDKKAKSFICCDEIKKFYDEYYEEIEDIRKDVESFLAISLTVKGDLKTFYYKMAFGHVARILAEESKDGAIIEI